MKTITTFALAAIMAIGLGACSEEGKNPNRHTGSARVTIQLRGVNVTPASRALEAGADENALDVVDGRSVIFVADATGRIVQAVDIVKAQAVNPAGGQELPELVALGSTVYVVANIPTGEVDALKALTELDDVKEHASAITTQSGFGTPTMANKNGDEKEVTDADASGDETVTISIEPLYARLELVALQAIPDANGNTITEFDVTGVFVDGHFPRFDYTGAVPAGDVAYSLSEELEVAADAAAKAAVYTGWSMKDVNGPWSADGTPLIAQLTDQVWGYNVVASGLPRLVIRLENIVYSNSGSSITDEPISGARYLTVVGYYDDAEDEEVASFERGEVYRVGTITAGNSNFKFSYANLGLEPNEESVSLTVGVDVETWSVKDYSPIL